MSTGNPPSQPREWMPRLWEGCNFSAWMNLLIRNNFAVHFRYWYIAAIITVVSSMHSLLWLVQRVVYGRRPDQTPLEHAPLFIVGHWRTGTTLLHELLILDERYTFPNTYCCLEPNHFLLTEKLFTRLFWFLMPSRRPMDNMAMGWHTPQEDEFALCMMGQPSPYLTIAFPNRPPQCQEAFDLDGLSPRQKENWKKAFLHFLHELTFKDPRRLVLKSPTHSCRIPTLLEMFPRAQFVHILRDPLVVFPSTLNLWKSLYETHGMQKPTFERLEEQVFQTFNHLYDRIEEGKKLIPPGQFHELRYEQLVADPVETMRKLYQELNLGEFDRLLPRLEQYLAEHANYRTNRFPQLTEEKKAEIRQRWGGVMQRYGYGEKAIPS